MKIQKKIFIYFWGVGGRVRGGGRIGGVRVDGNGELKLF